MFFGVGAILVTGNGNGVQIALAHGLAIALMVTAFAHISGGHFNPAITLGFLVVRRIEATLAAVYWVMQFAAPVSPRCSSGGFSPSRRSIRQAFAWARPSSTT